MKDITKKYSNGEVTIVWQPSMCSHSTKCFKGLGEVFNPQRRPWITPEAATTEKIIEQVKQCPSGALSFYYNEARMDEAAEEKEVVETRIEIVPNGPLQVFGNLNINTPNGIVKKENKTSFCRCGASANKPFCDGTHRKIDFQG